jgi:hypothetical protein
VTCRITKFVNSPISVSARFSLSMVAFGASQAGFAPLYTQSAVKFPAIVEQSLGSNRPRVS